MPISREGKRGVFYSEYLSRNQETIVMIRSLLHVGMTIPDLETGRAFYERFGLHAGISGNDLGRHVGGSNYFQYLRDPWNGLAQYFWDIDVIPEDDRYWTPLNVDPEEVTAVCVWAKSPPPPDFRLNFELQD